MDWKRLCFRSTNSSNEKIIGVVVMYNKEMEKNQEVNNKMKDISCSDGHLFTFYEKNKVTVICSLSKKQIECPIYTRKIAAKACKQLVKEKVECILIQDTSFAPWIAEAAVLSTYQYDLNVTKKKEQVLISYTGEDPEVKKAITIAEAQNFCRFLVDTPANLMTPTLFTKYAKEYLPDEVEVIVHNKKEIEDKKMGLFLGVSRGSVEEPKLLEIRYMKGKDLVALVGKGITFDSGGISLKPSGKMALMKGDMGGAAAVLSTIGALARMSAPVSVIGVIPLAENLPSGTATKPGDVHIGSGGKSVEVDNTDAEGRLVLADALNYALSFSPKKIVDIATLTGAMKVCLGPAMFGLFSNSDEMAKEIERIGKEVGDRTWRLPLIEEYKEFLSSDVADLKNISNKPEAGAGSITAALFLQEFIESNSVQWAHLDIASVSFNSVTPDLYGKGATGRPVKLLSFWMQSNK